ncbi:MAG: hypothetical protein QOF51_3748, partial [Chloroflexota bacterium]|nr:hypothetical protein [Chloroflexota bacterium]
MFARVSHSVRITLLIVPCIAVLAITLLLQSTPVAQGGTADGVFDFGLTGDQLYGPDGIAKWPALQAGLDAAPLSFVVFGGDFKNGSTVCDDATFADRLQRFSNSAHPFVFLPGDNEWTDCWRENNGSYD